VVKGVTTTHIFTRHLISRCGLTGLQGTGRRGCFYCLFDLACDDDIALAPDGATCTDVASRAYNVVAIVSSSIACRYYYLISAIVFLLRMHVLMFLLLIEGMMM